MNEKAVLAKYRERQKIHPDRHGWSFHYTPESRISTAKVMIIGLNPGGGQQDDIGSWQPKRGNAYLDERWGANNSLSTLQKQIGLMIAASLVDPSEFAAANLVPFRSPGWDELRDAEDAVAWSVEMLWRPLVARLSARLFLCFGYRSGTEIAGLLQAESHRVSHDLQWGGKKVFEYTAPDGRIVLSFPHLSYYQVFSGDRVAAKEVVSAAANKAFENTR